jgi:hypothetical protein
MHTTPTPPPRCCWPVCCEERTQAQSHRTIYKPSIWQDKREAYQNKQILLKKKKNRLKKPHVINKHPARNTDRPNNQQTHPARSYFISAAHRATFSSSLGICCVIAPFNFFLKGDINLAHK